MRNDMLTLTKNLMILLFMTILVSSCGKNEPLTQLKEGSHLLVEELGSFLEEVGQAPRKIGNKLLGTSEDTDEDLKDLENEVEQNYNLMVAMFSEVYSDISDLETKVDDNNQNMVTALQDQYDVLIDQINAGDKKNKDKIRKLFLKIKKLKRKVANIKRNVRRIQQRISYYRTVLRGLYRRVDALENDDNLDALQQLIADNQARISVLENAQDIVEIIDPCGDKPGHFDEVVLKLENGTFLAYFESGSKRFLTILRNGYFRTTDVQRCSFRILNGQLID